MDTSLIDAGGFISSFKPIYRAAYTPNTFLPIYHLNEFTELPTFKYQYGAITITITNPKNETEIIRYGGDSTGGKLYKLNYPGIYLIHYEGTNIHQVTATRNYYSDYSFYFRISAVENKRPLKKWTITDVINRTLDVAEPIRRGEEPRFRLNEEQAQKFDKILAPQFSFTKQTLRECLQEIGKVIHGEPRLKIKKQEYVLFNENVPFTNGRARLGSTKPDYDAYTLIDGEYILLGIDEIRDMLPPFHLIYYWVIPNSEYSGMLPGYRKQTDDKKYYYEVSYDMYASQEKSGIYTLPYKLKTVSQVIDSYTAWLDSNAENLVNQLDKFSGVIVEPYDGGAKTVRTESMYVRINDDNMLIPTQYPIYTVDKLEYVYTDNGEVKSLNITPWLFEQSIYNTQLSSYAEQYPYSKAYGLYYTQGSKNIGGLNFIVDSAAFADFKDYAIVNVIRQASGNNSLPIAKEEFEGAKYPNMCFRVTYTPFYNVRVAQTKPYYKDFKRPAALIYNQQSNIVESRYYGENLKGAIARLGNIELSLTYRLYRLSDIPKAGQMYDKNYYISAVAVEYLPTCIKCTIGLSKDFNRLSAYIGINSEKRFSEVSQNQAVERNTLWREYIVIGKQETPDSTALIGSNMLSAIADTFTQSQGLKQITCVTAWGTSFQSADMNAVNLPVISSAFGNSISFSWAYEDNYSAGAISHYENVTDGPKGYFQNNYPYADYYGRMYYYNFDLELADDTPTADNLAEKGRKLPGATKAAPSRGYVSTVGKMPYILRKDNREILQCNFQIDFVTNLENFIIGSALASYCPAVRGSDSSLRARLYVFDTELNKFTDHVEAFENVNLSDMDSAEVSVTMGDGYFTVNAEAFPVTETGNTNGKSWAIITQQTITSTEEVEDEKGSVSTQSNVYGGDLLIGQNIEVASGQSFTPIYFTKKRDIFDRTVWKDIR